METSRILRKIRKKGERKTEKYFWLFYLPAAESTQVGKTTKKIQ